MWGFAAGGQAKDMPRSPEELFARFEELGIATKTYTHPPLFTVEESRRLRGDLAGGHCKSLFFKDKKDKYWLVVTLEDRPVDIKLLEARLGSARLSFARPERLMEVLGVVPGSVTPFALINDAERQVTVILDKQMLEHDPLNYHPLHNAATTAIAPQDLLKFIQSCGHEPRVVEL
jgi:Ala-tRNA(Pro) deacylase